MQCPTCGNPIDTPVDVCPYCGASLSGRIHLNARQIRFKTVNLEKGMPSVEEARQRLHIEIGNARMHGTRVFKLIHGYGSSGVGGKLRLGIRRSLAAFKKQKRIRSFIPGEELPRDTESRRLLLSICPELESDADLNRQNKGITFVIIF